MDCRLTLDGHVVNFHDDTTLLKGMGLLPVEWMTLSELKALDMGSWFAPEFHGAKVATLEEILRLAIPNKLYLRLELKKPSVQSAVEELMDRYGAWPLLGSSVEGTFSEREVLTMPYLVDDLWMTGGEDDTDHLRGLMKAHGKKPFRVNVDDCRIFCAVLGRRAELRELKTAISPRACKQAATAAARSSELRKQLSGKDRRAAWQAALQLARAGNFGVLGAALKNQKSSSHAQEAATWSLAHMDVSDADVSPLLELAMALRKPEVTQMVAYTIGRRRMQSGTELLRRLFRDGAAFQVRTAAVWALGEMDDLQSMPLHRGVVMDGGAEIELRLQSVNAIGKVRDMGGRDALVNALGTGPPPVSLLSVVALGQLGHGKSAALIGTLLRQNREMPLKAWAVITLCNALAKMGPSGEAILINAAAQNDPIIRREALLALARGGASILQAAQLAGMPEPLLNRLKTLTANLPR